MAVIPSAGRHRKISFDVAQDDKKKGIPTNSIPVNQP